MTGRHGDEQAVLDDLEIEFKQRSMEFLNKMDAWDRGTGYSLHDKVSEFFPWFRKYPQPLLLLSRLRAHHPVSFTHSVDVALLTLIQVEAANLPAEEQREAAFTGLLHDVGKIAVPAAVLDKKDKLTRQEAARISVHSVAGARALAAMTNLPRLVVVGAYEHHLHHDGVGGYPRPTRCRIPHPVSQMIAQADFFDSLTTRKPYRQEQPRQRVLQMMREREGRVFHPQLLQTFLGCLGSLN